MSSTIGNEHFKCWLKKLDPVARVQKMSAIAKTQFSYGIKGSIIKTSLAQLSQRCQVMLIRLTDKEIKHYTRRKPVKRLKTSEGKKCDTSVKCNVPNKTYLDSVQKVSSVQKKSETSQILQSDRYLKTQVDKKECAVFKSTEEPINASAVKPTNNILSPKVSKARKKKYRELFGDDLDDLTESSQRSNDLSDVNSSGREANIKNYFSTVNVNIYNPSRDSQKIMTEIVVENKSNPEKKLLCTKKPSNKKLKTDVSVPNDITSIYKENLDFFSQQQEKLNKMIAETIKQKTKRKPKPSSRKIDTHKHKAKQSQITAKPKSPCQDSVDLEDSSIKKIWSILGMESPTDRSESIIKSRPFTFVREKNNVNIYSTQPINQATTDFTSVQTSLSSSDTEIEPNINNVSEDVYPVCKIATTFSLADCVPVEEADSFKNTVPKSSPKKHDHDDIRIHIDEEEIMCKEQSRNNKTFCNDSSPDLGDFGDKSCRKKREDNTEEHKKIGTIRVKSLGQLMNPELVSQLNKPENVAVESSSSVNNVNEQDEVKERFFLTYKYYFDRNVESVIPILGEILHLAIADLIRKEERIKRAEQLSSDDLINDEKQRAEKDFNDMMKTRGNEFSPLIGNILEKFDKNSKKTLFVTLFCRLVKHAEKIDSLNKNYFLKARHVIRVMLSKHQFTDEDIKEVLFISPEEFQIQVDRINEILTTCTNAITTSTTISSNKTQDISSVSSSPSPVRNINEVISSTSGINSSIKVCNSTITNTAKNAIPMLGPSTSIIPILNTEKHRNILLTEDVISTNNSCQRTDISQQPHAQTSNVNQTALSIAKCLPDITVTEKRDESTATNNNRLRQMIVNSLQPSVQDPNFNIVSIASSNTESNCLSPQYTYSSKHNNITTTNNSQLHQLISSSSSQPSVQNDSNFNNQVHRISSNTCSNGHTLQHAENSKQNERTMTNSTTLRSIICSRSNTGSNSLLPQNADSSKRYENTTTNNGQLRKMISSNLSQPSVQNDSNVRWGTSNSHVPQHAEIAKNLQALYNENVSKRHLSVQNSGLKPITSSTNGLFTKKSCNAPIGYVNLHGRPYKSGVEFNGMSHSFNMLPNSRNVPDVDKSANATEKTIQQPSIMYTTTTTIFTPGTRNELQSQPCNRLVNPDDMSLTLRHLLDGGTQVPLPSSSHCHPFVNRMPISGKLKMLFGSNS